MRSFWCSLFCVLSFSAAFAQMEPKLYPVHEEISGITSTQFKTAATTSGDTLVLPFFDDFTGYDKRIDSLVIKNGQPARLYSKHLNFVGNNATIVLSFPDSILPGILNKYPIHGKAHIQKESAGIYNLDTTNTGFTTPIIFSSDTTMYTAYWSVRDTVYNKLDSYRWESSDVNINNRFAVRPPSFNVATFDGLKSTGAPYSQLSTDIGFTDVLTSRVINMWDTIINPNRVSPGDSVYLSFYFQSKGFGGASEDDDYLSVQFLDSTGTWNTVWIEYGISSLLQDTFLLVNIPVKDKTYFTKKGFKFRFRAYGRQSGMYDVWNVDYVYLNKKRSNVYSPLQDWTLGEMGNTFLRNYSSIPYRHFLPDKVAQSDSIPFTVLNLSKFGFANVIVYGTCFDNLGSFLDNRVVVDGYSNDNTYSHSEIFKPTVNTLGNPLDPRFINQELKVETKDTAITFLHNNNKFTTYTTLYNYYAYDDGSAEAGLGFQVVGARMALQYKFIQDDTINNIDFKFVRTKGPDMFGRSIIMKVWDNTFTELRSQVISVRYDTLARYALNNPLPIDSGSTYYIGYQQNFIDLLTVGFDRNTNRADKIYYYDGSTFQPYISRPNADSGALMIRPVFLKSGENLVPIIDPLEKQDFTIYPNPANSSITIMGDVKHVSIVSLLGETLINRKLDFNDQYEHVLDISSLKPGVYLLQANNVIKRLIVY